MAFEMLTSRIGRHLQHWWHTLRRTGVAPAASSTARFIAARPSARSTDGRGDRRGLRRGRAAQFAARPLHALRRKTPARAAHGGHGAPHRRDHS